MLRLSRVEDNYNINTLLSPRMMDSDAVHFPLRVAEIFSCRASYYWSPAYNRCVDFITYIKFIGAIKALEK